MVKFNFDDTNTFGGIGKFGGKSAVNQQPKFSYKDALGFVVEHKVESICLGFVLLTLLIIIPFLMAKTAEINSLSSEIQLLTEKESPIADINKFSAEGKLLMDGLPSSLPENRFITQLTSLAGKRDVIVTAVTPPDTKYYGFFRQISTQISCSVNGFNSALLFVNDIEQSEYALKVDSWKIRQSNSSDQGGAWNSGDSFPGNKSANSSVKLDMVLVVSSIEILGNEKNNRSK